MKTKNNLFTITGPSGAGKTTVLRKIMGKNQEIISFTTRHKRNNEVEGEDYIFLSKEEYLELLHNDGLFEHAEYVGNYYGITKEEFFPKITANDCFFITVLDGLKQIEEHYDKVVSIFMYTDRESIEKQLRERGSTEEEIKVRLENYDKDMKVMHQHNYDYVIKNKYGKFDETVDLVKQIISIEK